MGKDYPAGYQYFRDRLKNAFLKNRDVTEPEKLDTLLKHGQFVTKEIEALYMLKKYRTLKNRYYPKDLTERERMLIIEELVKNVTGP